MSIAQRHNGITAFRSSPSGQIARTPLESPRRRVGTAPHPSPLRRQREGKVPAVQTRQRGQNAAMLMMVITAAVIVTMGLAYLSGYARLTQEGYQRAKLKGMLRQQREMAQQWRQRQALMTSPVTIEQKAVRIGMVPCNDQKTITVSRSGNSPE